MRSIRPLLAVSITAILLLAGCGGDGERFDQFTVFAASSLTEAFMALGDAYAQTNPDADPTFTFASSSDLARQIGEGADAAVFASADQKNMTKVTDAGASGTGEPQVFATNQAEIIVGPGNPLGITGLADLAAGDLIVVVCAPEVPCGTYADEVLANAGVELTPDSLEENVKAVATKVTLGEADAGIVYATDVIAAGPASSGVVIADDVNVVAQYPIVALADAPPAAQGFIDFVLSPDGQQILAGFGFGPP